MPPWPKQADCSVTFIILCVAVTRHDFCVTPSRLIEGTAARPSYDAPTTCVTDPRLAHDHHDRPLTTLPRPLCDASRIYKKLILKELLQYLSVFIVILLHRSEFTNIINLAIRPRPSSSARMMDLVLGYYTLVNSFSWPQDTI